MKPNQVVLQLFVLQVVFWGRRIPSPAIYRSLATSITMIMLAITKTLMSKQISHSKKISKLKQVKQLLWIVSLAATIFTANITNSSQLFLQFYAYGKDFNRESPSSQKGKILGFIGVSTILFIMCIPLFKNCCKRHLQTRIRFIIISIYHILTCVFYSMGIIMVFVEDTGNGGIVVPLTLLIILNSSLALVFTKAAFSVSKLNDIWSLEKMTSKELCCIPNLLFSIVILSFLIFVLELVRTSIVGDPYYA